MHYVKFQFKVMVEAHIPSGSGSAIAFKNLTNFKSDKDSLCKSLLHLLALPTKARILCLDSL